MITEDRLKCCKQVLMLLSLILVVTRLRRGW